MKKTKKNTYKQFFTPRRVVNFMIDFAACVDKEILEKPVSFLDPACGEGVFINAAADFGITQPSLCMGIDRDESLADKWKQAGLSSTRSFHLVQSDGLSYDDGRRYRLVMGNPPFGIMKLEQSRRNLYASYQLFQKFTNGGKRKVKSFPIEVLFLERFLYFTEPGGLTAIVLPSGICSNESMKYIREWLSENFSLKAVVSLERRVFTSEGADAYTTLLFIQNKIPGPDEKVFWALASRVDMNNAIPDHLDEVLESYKNEKSITDEDLLAFFAHMGEMGCERWDTGFHHPVYNEYSEKLKSGGFPLAALGELIGEDEIFTGYKGVQKFASTDDRIPYITSRNVTDAGIDLTKNPSFIDRNTPPDTPRTRIRENDVLMVRSGEGCVGRTVVAGKEDEGSNVRSEIYVIRPNREKLNPYYLAAFLQSFKIPFRREKKTPAHLAHFQVARLAAGVGTPNLNKKEILSIKIPVIPIDVQKKIERIYKEIRRIHHKSIFSQRASALMNALTRELETYITSGESSFSPEILTADGRGYTRIL